MAKKNSPYFDSFITMGGFCVQAAEYLQSVLTKFEAKQLSAKRKAMHKIEHDEDEVKHDIMRRLVKEFVPPIDREDIIQLANELDNVTDKIEDTLIRMYMYNIETVKLEALAFADVIVRSCKALHVALEEFPNFQKSTKLMDTIIKINSLEEEGDAIYVDAMRKLYQSNEHYLTISAWSKLFDLLEDCCDTCEHVADTMELIAMKNS